MKKLQNNFTTPEQSKRLLELGVPAGSADCVRVVRTDMVFFMQHGKVTKDYLSLYKSARGEEAEPCWSVGRLMEIFVMARGYEDGFMSIDGRNPIEYLIKLFTANRNEKFKLDFSKLEV